MSIKEIVVKSRAKANCPNIRDPNRSTSYSIIDLDSHFKTITQFFITNMTWCIMRNCLLFIHNFFFFFYSHSATLQRLYIYIIYSTIFFIRTATNIKLDKVEGASLDRPYILRLVDLFGSLLLYISPTSPLIFYNLCG